MTFRLAVVVAGVMLALYAGLALNYVRRCSPTMDEPVHLVSAVAMRDTGDFRVNDHPPLWERWAALAVPAGMIVPQYSGPDWERMKTDLTAQVKWSADAMYPAPPEGVAVAARTASALFRARCMMLVWSVGAGVVTCWLTWLLGRAVGMEGRGAATAMALAAALFALDPTLLGHGALMKNDVASALFFALTVAGLLLVGRGVSVASVVTLAGGIGVGLATKFSAVLLVPVVVVMLVLRAIFPGRWRVLGREVHTRAAKIWVAGGVLVVSAVLAWGVLWGAYGFRYAMTPEGEAADLQNELTTLKIHLVRERYRVDGASSEQIAEQALPLTAQGVVWANEHRLLPSAWARGLVFTLATTVLRDSYLLCELSPFGWKGYFPLAVACKEPLGALGLVALAGGAAAWVGVRWKVQRKSWAGGEAVYGVAAVALPVVLYGAGAISGHMDAGIRHLIAIYPLVGALVAVGLVRWVWPWRGGRVAVGVLLAAMAVETLASADRLIAFFNVPARLMGPERLLADSNLDWGQDLPKLVAWQEKHPEEQLAGLLYGPAPAEAYGLRYLPATGSGRAWSAAEELPKRGVFAVSATWLQEMYLPRDLRGSLAVWRFQRPREVLGGTIFLYDLPATKEKVLPADERWKLYERTPGGERVALPLRPTRGRGEAK